MTKADDELVNPVTGLRTVFRKTARETNGELLQVDLVDDLGWTTGPDHVYPRQQERFEILSGKLGPRVDGRSTLVMVRAHRRHAQGSVIGGPTLFVGVFFSNLLVVI